MMMTRTLLLPVLAAVGLGFAMVNISVANRPTPVAQPVTEAASSPYATFVAGSGLIEANTENIALGAPEAGLVTRVFAKPGDAVKAGDPLLQIDDCAAKADLEVRRAAQASAEAAVREAEVALEDIQARLALWEALDDKRAVSREEMTGRRFAGKAAEARLARARADAALEKARVEAAATELERLTVRAPVAGQVLQLKTRAGEFAPAGRLDPPLILLGGVEPLHVRVDIDENEAWRVKAGAPALGFLRGNPTLKADLAFVRFEPYVVPKRSLTGESTERVDTRVLQVLYSFPKDSLPCYVGQQMDVFIQAPGREEKKP